MSFPVLPGGGALLNELERATARLSGLNPADSAFVHDALAIEGFIAWIAACQTPFDPDPELTACIEKALAAGAQLAVRLTLVRADVSTQMAELGAASACWTHSPDAKATPPPAGSTAMGSPSPLPVFRLQLQ